MTAQHYADLWSDVIKNGRKERPTEAVLSELSEYSKLSLSEVKNIIENTGKITAEKWKSKAHSKAENLFEFYNSVSNWVFGTSFYHARQAEGSIEPSPALPVQVAMRIQHKASGTHLDFGAGVGTASLLFSKIGWTVALADVSDPLLDFARWRFAQRNIAADVIDLKTERLGLEQYDLITAFNTMAHVPVPEDTIKDLRAALKPNGMLVFDIDARKASSDNQWHLYKNHSKFIAKMRKNGFVSVDRIGEMYVYQRSEMTAIQRFVFGLYDQVRYSSGTMKIAELSRPARNAVKRLMGRRSGPRKVGSWA